MNIKRNIRYNVLAKKSDPSEGYVQATITWCSKRVRVCPGLAVSLSGWVAERGRCKPRSYHGEQKIPAMTINTSLDEFENKIEDFFRECEIDDRIPEVDEVKEYLAPPSAKEKANLNTVRKYDATQRIAPVFELYCKENEELGLWRQATIMKNRRMKDILLGVSENLTFLDLEQENAMSRVLTKFATLEGKDKSKGLSNTTISKNLGFIRTFLRWAHEKGYIPPNRFVNQKARLTTPRHTIVYLTWQELMAVYKHDYSNEPSKDRVRDAFCFCCFTSLRFSDLRNLKWTNVDENAIELTTIKTTDKIRIDLNKYSRSLLDKYRSMPSIDNRVFPVISNQKFNDYLKEIGKDCRLTSPVSFTVFRGNKRTDTTVPKYRVLSSHAARRTFISNALSMGIPPDVVMKWTGHSDYAAMKPYIEILDEAKRNAMDLFDER